MREKEETPDYSRPHRRISTSRRTVRSDRARLLTDAGCPERHRAGLSVNVRSLEIETIFGTSLRNRSHFSGFLLLFDFHEQGHSERDSRCQSGSGPPGTCSTLQTARRTEPSGCYSIGHRGHTRPVHGPVGADSRKNSRVLDIRLSRPWPRSLIRITDHWTRNQLVRNSRPASPSLSAALVVTSINFPRMDLRRW